MANTVQEGTATRRQLLARIALLDLPAPDSIDFRPIDGQVWLSFHLVADGRAWIEYLGGDADTYAYRDGHTYLRSYSRLRLAGWPVNVEASEPTAQEPAELADETRAALTELAEVQA